MVVCCVMIVTINGVERLGIILFYGICIDYGTACNTLDNEVEQCAGNAEYIGRRDKNTNKSSRRWPFVSTVSNLLVHAWSFARIMRPIGPGP